MIETWENDKNPNFRPNFGPFDQIWAAKNFFVGFTPPVVVMQYIKLLTMQFPGKLMNQTSKKPNFGPNFGLFGPNLPLPSIFFVDFNSASS